MYTNILTLLQIPPGYFVSHLRKANRQLGHVTVWSARNLSARWHRSVAAL